MTICERFVKALDLNVEERYVGFVNRCKKSGCSCYLHSHQIFLVEVWNSRTTDSGEVYDGAAVMTGSEIEVQSQIPKVHPLAVYIHCMAPKLTLVLVEACKVNRMVNSFFFTLETFYCFFAQPINHAFKEAQRSLEVKSEIGMISDTRWGCG